MEHVIGVIEKLNDIIKIQSDIIDELFILLLQHIEASEADRLPVIKKINIAAKLRDEINEA